MQVALITMSELPRNSLLRIGGVVSARSVKLLGFSKDAQPTRDSWWTELREEVRVHARTLGCSAVIGYTESTAYHGELTTTSRLTSWPRGTALRGRLSGTALRQSLATPFALALRPPLATGHGVTTSSELPRRSLHPVSLRHRRRPRQR